MSNPKKMLSVKEVADELGVTENTVWRWNKDKPDFPNSYKFGERVTRWKREDIEAWRAKHEDKDRAA